MHTPKIRGAKFPPILLEGDSGRILGRAERARVGNVLHYFELRNLLLGRGFGHDCNFSRTRAGFVHFYYGIGLFVKW